MERFSVESASHPGTYHVVAIDGDDADCDCPAFEYRRTCRHVQQARELMAAENKHANIYEAMAAAYRECGYVQKQRANDLNYRFAGERAMIEEIRPAMVNHGIFVYPHAIREVKRETYQTARGSTMNLVGLVVTYRFAHESGEQDIVVEAYGEGADVGDKAAPKAMTGAFKYALRQAFCIETGDDPDNTPSTDQERADHPNTPPPPQTRQRRPPDAPQGLAAEVSRLLKEELAMTDVAEKADMIGWVTDVNPVELGTQSAVTNALMAWAGRTGIREDIPLAFIARAKARPR